MLSKDEARSQLISAGIGDRYIDYSLSSFGDVGKRLLEVAEDRDVAAGFLNHGLLIYLHGPGARDLALTFAGGLLTTYKATTEVTHLSNLSDVLDSFRDENLQERAFNLEAAQILVVTEFLNTCSKSLSDRSAFRVESFLLDRSETEGRTLILVGETEIANATDWWSNRLIQRIQESFIQEHVAKHAQARPTL